MGFLGKATTVASVALFSLYLGNLVFSIVSLFFPTFYFPYYNPRPTIADPAQAKYHQPYFAPDQTFRAAVYVAPEEDSKDVAALARFTKPIWTTPEPIRLAEFDVEITHNVSLPVPHQLAPSRWADARRWPVHSTLTVMVYPAELELADAYPGNNPEILIAATPLVLHTERTALQEHNLLGDVVPPTPDSPTPSPTPEKPSIAPHWKTRVAVEMVDDHNAYLHGRVPGDFARQLQVMNSPADRPYLPLLGPNSMGTRKEHLKELEPTDQPTWDMPLTVQLKTVALGWYRVTRIMDATFAQLSAGGSPLAVSGNELESLRKMIFEVNPTLLLITIVAACLHMLFETLAVKSDIDHWSRKKSITGISRSSVFMGALTSWLTLLYVWDRRKDSGMLVLTGTAVSAVVELWKVFKVRRFLRQPAVANEDVSKVSNEKKMNDPVSVDQAIPTTDTASLEDFDNRVVKYLLYLCIPLIIGYAGYSLVFWKHKGFYSWGLDALMASIYLLGFVNMTPQLFLNHRLQSVEAMSLATFIYRAINTFVDDLFALVIPMPGLTRVSAFRDDIIFVVLLYQWWKFPKRASSDEDSQDTKIKIE